MSNCHFVAGRSLIDLVASRLALRTPALRAATALTRPNQSAQRLPCGRHALPIAESFERWIPITRAQRRHVEHIANGRATAPDTTHSLELATLEVVGRDTDERSDLRTGELAKLGQERNQAACQYN